MDYSRIEHFIFNKMSESRLPSVTAALIKNNDLIWTTALGFRDLEKALPANRDTLYGVGSITKTFTALSILQLAETGKLSLDDLIEKYVPLTIRPFGEQIRIRHFLSHTSGIPAVAMSESAAKNKTGGGTHWLPISSYDDLLTFMQDAQDWVAARPGERWFYLNEGYILLGKIIEICSRQPFFEYVREHILKPLGMQRTCFYADQWVKDRNTAVPYEMTIKGERIPCLYPFTPINSKGGIITCVTELAKYISMYLNGGEAPGGRLINPETFKEMCTPCIQTSSKEGYFGINEYALGFETHSNFLGRRLIGHGGSVRVSTAYFGFLPQDGYGVAIMANGSGYSPEYMGMYLLAAALGENPEELPFVKNETLLNELCGNYKTYQGTTSVVVKKSGDMLVLAFDDLHNPYTVTLFPYQLEKDPVTFYTVAGGSKSYIEFHRKSGQTTMLVDRYAFRKY